MVKEIDRELKHYYKNISKALVCDSKEKSHILNAIKSSIACYISDNSDASAADVISHFGSADDVAAEYCNSQAPSELITKIKRGRFIVRAVVIAIAIALLVYLVAVVAMVIADIKASDGYHIIT